MEFRNGHEEQFSQPVAVHGRDSVGFIHDRAELYEAISELFWGLTKSNQRHMTNKLHGAIECMLTGRRPKNIVDVIGDSGNRQITHLFKGKIKRCATYSVALRWEPEQAPPLELISIRWHLLPLLINRRRHKEPMGRMKRSTLESQNPAE